jgi:hypothetical protein
MDRRLFLGGLGAIGAVAVGAPFQAGAANRPTLVFVGHEL